MPKKIGSELSPKLAHSPDETQYLRDSIGYHVRVARESLRLAVWEAAREIGISEEFLTNIERGDSLPLVPLLLRIADVLDISVDDMFAGYDDEPHTMPPNQVEVSADLEYLVTLARRCQDFRIVLWRLLKYCHNRQSCNE